MRACVYVLVCVRACVRACVRVCASAPHLLPGASPHRHCPSLLCLAARHLPRCKLVRSNVEWLVVLLPRATALGKVHSFAAGRPMTCTEALESRECSCPATLLCTRGAAGHPCIFRNHHDYLTFSSLLPIIHPFLSLSLSPSLPLFVSLCLSLPLPLSLSIVSTPSLSLSLPLCLSFPFVSLSRPIPSLSVLQAVGKGGDEGW